MLEGIMDKVKSNAGTIGGVLGFVGAPSTTEPYGGVSGVARIMESLDNAIGGNIHFPDLQKVAYEFTTDQAKKNMILVYIGAEIAKNFGLPIVGPWMAPLQKFAMSYLGGSVLQSVLYRSTHSTGSGTNLNSDLVGVTPSVDYYY